MSSLEFRRNFSNLSKAKKQSRASDSSLLTTSSNVKNYLSYFNSTKNTDKENQGLEETSQSRITPKVGLRRK